LPVIWEPAVGLVGGGLRSPQRRLSRARIGIEALQPQHGRILTDDGCHAIVAETGDAGPAPGAHAHLLPPTVDEGLVCRLESRIVALHPRDRSGNGPTPYSYP
jgi:hypothetical protein